MNNIIDAEHWYKPQGKIQIEAMSADKNDENQPDDEEVCTYWMTLTEKGTLMDSMTDHVIIKQN